MKKLLITVAIIGSIFSSAANAKTQGHYVGLDLISTNQKVLITSSDGSSYRYNGRDPGVGFNYKYAINYNKFFISPGIFYNYNNSEVNKTNDLGVSSSLRIKYSYGAKMDLGYDVTNKFAAFLSIGYIESRFGARQYLNNVPNVTLSPDADGTIENSLYGIGVKYSLENNLDINLAYEFLGNNNYTRHNLKTNSIGKLSTDFVKLGIAYKF